MLNLKVKPVGIDVAIQLFQQFLYNNLKGTWGLTDAEFDSHGRCYRNLIDVGYVPEVFVPAAEPDPANTTYKQVFFDETTMKACSFFTMKDAESYQDTAGRVALIAKVSLIFMVNISLIKTDLLHRGDEEIRTDVQKLCLRELYDFKPTSFETGYKTVFSEFDGWTKTDQVTFKDAHPLHCFRINFDVLYNAADNSNC
jgi:hypothetical protein